MLALFPTILSGIQKEEFIGTNLMNADGLRQHMEISSTVIDNKSKSKYFTNNKISKIQIKYECSANNIFFCCNLGQESYLRTILLFFFKGLNSFYYILRLKCSVYGRKILILIILFY